MVTKRWITIRQEKLFHAGAFPFYLTHGCVPILSKREFRPCWIWRNGYITALGSIPSGRHPPQICLPLTEADLSAGAAQDGQLLWGKTNWISGSRNVGPDSVIGVSSFDVLDALVMYYMDRKLYPNLKVTTLFIRGIPLLIFRSSSSVVTLLVAKWPSTMQF